MHHVYTTPAFVIHSAPQGEAGKFLLLFTKDFGMIGATAQGVRLVQSKLRYHLQDFSFSNVSVVRGKEVWRITGAYELDHKKETEVHLKVLKLLKRLLHGEEKNEKLFEIIESLYRTDIEKEKNEIVECLTVLRILNSLGYISETDEIKIYLAGTSLDHELLESAAKIKVNLVKSINAALAETQL